MDLGVICVEHLKECTVEEWIDLFHTERPITKRVAARVFSALKKEGVIDPKKCASQMGIATAATLVPTSVYPTAHRVLYLLPSLTCSILKRISKYMF